MKMLEQILKEAGAQTDDAFTVAPSFGGYFKAVKGVADYSREKIVLILKRRNLSIVGENLVISSFYAGDMVVTGTISGVNYE